MGSRYDKDAGKKAIGLPCMAPQVKDVVFDDAACSRPFDGVKGKTIAFDGTVIGITIFMGRGIGPLRGHHFPDKGGRKDAFAIEGSLIDEKTQDMGKFFVGNAEPALGSKDGSVGSDFVA